METIAGASGATLGYITGGPTGAFIGYKGAKKLYQKKMAVTLSERIRHKEE